jgi:hypothetical protein
MAQIRDLQLHRLLRSGEKHRFCHLVRRPSSIPFCEEAVTPEPFS